MHSALVEYILDKSSLEWKFNETFMCIEEEHNFQETMVMIIVNNFTNSEKGCTSISFAIECGIQVSLF